MRTRKELNKNHKFNNRKNLNQRKNKRNQRLPVEMREEESKILLPQQEKKEISIKFKKLRDHTNKIEAVVAEVEEVKEAVEEASNKEETEKKDKKEDTVAEEADIAVAAEGVAQEAVVVVVEKIEVKEHPSKIKKLLKVMYKRKIQLTSVLHLNSKVRTTKNGTHMIENLELVEVEFHLKEVTEEETGVRLLIKFKEKKK